jgi:hypothetical protein
MGEINSADGTNHHQDQNGGKQRVNNHCSLLKTHETCANQEPKLTGSIFSKLVEDEYAEMLPKEDNCIRAVSF